jgi:two-component system, chemotaxis family, sensor kinase CheA
MFDVEEEFVEESRDFLEIAEEQLLQLESSTNPRVQIDELFRVFHTIKGNSRFVQLTAMEKVAHAAEAVLVALRGRAKIERTTITALLFVVDCMRKQLEGLAEGDPKCADADKVIETLDEILAGLPHAA